MRDLKNVIFFDDLLQESYNDSCSRSSKKITFFKSRMGLPPLMLSYSDGDFFPACWK